MQLIELIKAVIAITEEAEKDLIASIKLKEFKKGTLLLKAGNVCSHLYYMRSGFAHQFHWKDKNKISNYFWEPKNFVAHTASFLSQTPCRENIELLDDCVLEELDYRSLQFMYKKHIELNIFGRLMVERYFVELADLAEMMKVKPASKRYQLFFDKYPQMFQLASLGQISSFLNISQETLSRLRKF